MAQLLADKVAGEVEVAHIVLHHVFTQMVAHSHDLVSIREGVVSREEDVLLVGHSVLEERTAWRLHFILILD